MPSKVRAYVCWSPVPDYRLQLMKSWRCLHYDYPADLLSRFGNLPQKTHNHQLILKQPCHTLKPRLVIYPVSLILQFVKSLSRVVPSFSHSSKAFLFLPIGFLVRELPIASRSPATALLRSAPHTATAGKVAVSRRGEVEIADDGTHLPKPTVDVSKELCVRQHLLRLLKRDIRLTKAPHETA